MKKAAETGGLLNPLFALQRTFNLKAPSLKQRLRNVLAVFIAPRPLPQTGGTDVLIRRQLKLLDRLFKRCHHWDHRPDRLRLAPVRIAASPCHICYALPFKILRVLWVTTLLGFGFLTACFGFNFLFEFAEKRAFSSLVGTKHLAKTLHYKAFFRPKQ